MVRITFVSLLNMLYVSECKYEWTCEIDPPYEKGEQMKPRDDDGKRIRII